MSPGSRSTDVASRRSAIAAAFVAVLMLAWACGGGGTSPSPVPNATLPTLSLSLAPGSLVGSSSLTGTVSVAGGSPLTAAMVVNLVSSNPAVSVPGSVTIAAQQTEATFAATTTQVPTATMVTVTVTSSGASGAASASVAVQPIPICGPFLAQQVAMPFFVYADEGDLRNHFIPSGFFGDIQDLTLNTGDRSSPHSGTTAIRIDYRPRGGQRFAGIYWQCPENNWGTVPNAGFNLSLARQVQFWARANASTRAEFKVGGIGRSPRMPFPDSFDAVSTAPTEVQLSTEWRQFTIQLRGDTSTTIGGFMFVTNTSQNPSGLTLFLDDIVWQ